jgi:hypothetical protein
MERMKFIGQSVSLRTPVFCRSQFTLYALLITIFMLLCTLPVSTFAADKLLIKDAGGTNTMFKVDDSGATSLGTANSNISGGISNFFGKTIFNPTIDGRAFLEFGSEQTGITSTIGGFVIYNTAIANTDKRVGQFFIATDGAINSGQIIFTTWNSGVASAKMVIRASGNIGIGTSSPQGKLDVNGTIYQRGGVLHADYVFEPTYKIETIEEHAKYMWENKHLQAVPGVTKDENGQEIVEVGSHQKGILEELEKAHIYIEQLANKIKALEATIEKLEK